MDVFFENVIHFGFQTAFGTRVFYFCFSKSLQTINEILASNLMEALTVKFMYTVGNTLYFRLIKYCKVFLVILNGRL